MSESRVESILENMLGASNVLEPPQSRVEALLQEVAKESGEIYIVNIKNNNNTYTADKTFSEIDDANDKGKFIICSFDIGMSISKMVKTRAGNEVYYVSNTMAIYSNIIMYRQYTLSSSNTVTTNTKKYNLSSLVTS